MDAVRAGSVTQWELRRNLEDRWLPGMSLTTSAGIGQHGRASRARQQSIGIRVLPFVRRRQRHATGIWGGAGARGIGEGGWDGSRRRRRADALSISRQPAARAGAAFVRWV